MTDEQTALYDANIDENTFKQVKTLLDLQDDSKNDLLLTIISITKSALLFKLGLSDTDSIPVSLHYILVEVSIRRFNRLKNEGFSQYTQEGESITFDTSDFDSFNDDIALWKRMNNKGDSLGTVQFLDAYAGRDHHDF